eukprot:COSAG02_NODE_25312_length_662_cov_1.003552_2_plen_132_part_00
MCLQATRAISTTTRNTYGKNPVLILPGNERLWDAEFLLEGPMTYCMSYVLYQAERSRARARGHARMQRHRRTGGAPSLLRAETQALHNDIQRTFALTNTVLPVKMKLFALFLALLFAVVQVRGAGVVGLRG